MKQKQKDEAGAASRSEEPIADESEPVCWKLEAFGILKKRFMKDLKDWQDETQNDQKKELACQSAACLVWFSEKHGLKPGIEAIRLSLLVRDPMEVPEKIPFWSRVKLQYARRALRAIFEKRVRMSFTEDGDFFGSTQLEIEVPMGSHSIRISMKTLPDGSLDYTFQEGL